MIKVGYHYDESHYDCCSCCGVLVIDYKDGQSLDVAVETEERWRQAYAQWLLVKAEIDERLEAIERQRIKEAQQEAYPHLAWFEEHRRKLREDPSYSYPHDTITFGDTSYSVSNKRYL